MAIEAGTRLGAYEVIDLIGAGGMGEVYRARDLRLGREGGHGAGQRGRSRLVSVSSRPGNR